MESIIKELHERNYEVLEILLTLALKHNILISKSTLERRLKSMNLKKYKVQSPINEIISKIMDELQFSGQLLGYRSMWKRLILTHKLNVKRETIQLLLKEIDPEGCLIRMQKKFKKRIYSTPGPNHIWHIDGYDKLKPYGFPIHACIDGYSRKVIWIKVRIFI